MFSSAMVSMLLLQRGRVTAFAGAGRGSFIIHDLRAASTAIRPRRRLLQLLPSRSSADALQIRTRSYDSSTPVASASSEQVRVSSSSKEAQQSEVDILGQVERAVEQILRRYSSETLTTESSNSTTKKGKKQQRDAILHSLPASSERECLGVAYHLQARFTAMHTHQTCRRCWLHPEHCICAQVQSLEHALPASINRIFVLAHHKEVGMLIDTAKLIFMAFPESARLVVSGLSAHYQEAMLEFQQALQQPSTLILFPDAECAKTLAEWRACDKEHRAQRQQAQTGATESGEQDPNEQKIDIVVIDGTWEQARRMYQRYMIVQSNENNIDPVPARRVQLSPESLASLAPQSFTNDDDDDDANNNKHSNNARRVVTVGQQLRRHPEPVRQIATAHALHLLLQDVLVEAHRDSNNNNSNDVAEASIQLKRLEDYQTIANAAARRQLPSVRYRKGKDQHT